MYGMHDPSLYQLVNKIPAADRLGTKQKLAQLRFQAARFGRSFRLLHGLFQIAGVKHRNKRGSTVVRIFKRAADGALRNRDNYLLDSLVPAARQAARSVMYSATVVGSAGRAKS
jgi:hypothetical protein